MGRKGRTKKAAGAPLDEPFLIREVSPSDLDRLVELAAHLNSVNLPNDRARLKRSVRRARSSFTGKIEDPFQREYLFVIEGATSKTNLG